MKYRITTKSVLLIALALCLSSTAPAWAEVVNGGTDIMPLEIAGKDCGGTLYIGTTVETWANLTGNFTNLTAWNAVRIGSSFAAHVTVQGDIGQSTSRANNAYFGYTGGAVDGSTITLNSGTLYTNRLYTDGTGNVTVNLNGGSVDSLYGVELGNSAANTFTVNQTGGTVNVTYNSIMIGDQAAGTYNIAGGTLSTSTGGDMSIRNGATLHVDGAGGTINIADQFSVTNGTLKFTVGSDGVSTILCGLTRSAMLSGTVDMELAAGFTPTDGALYDLIDIALNGEEYWSFDPNALGLTLASGDVGTWTLVVKDGDASVLQAQYGVPEPATMGLLGMGLLGLVLRRRR